MMQEIVFLGFRATATDPLGKEYDASFMISFPAGAVRGQDVQYMVDQETKKFHELHPNGKILERLQKVIMMHG